MDLMTTPREYTLECELKQARQRIMELEYELGNLPSGKVSSEHVELTEVPRPYIEDRVSLDLHSSIKATRNEYGAIHVKAVGRGEGTLSAEYYVAGVGWKDADNAALLGRSHLDFIRMLARHVDKQKL